MELASQKRAKICKRKRITKNRRRNQRKFEVRRSKLINGLTTATNIPSVSTMQENINFPITTTTTTTACTTTSAQTFWANYKVAQDWQQKHNVAWWKSRCMALEYENNILREKVRELAEHAHQPSSSAEWPTNNDEIAEEPLEFHVDEDMLNFLEHSIRHKMELKKTRQCDETTRDSKGHNDNKQVHIPEIRDSEKLLNAENLYGSAGMKIIAMETALQVSLDKYRDSFKPHYWPNIPLKP